MSKITSIYMAQLCHQDGNQFQNKCFPLAIGYMAAYLQQVFKDQLHIELFKSPLEFNTALEGSCPDIVMLSSYMWNENLTLTFIDRIKKKYPNTLVVLGGPNISLDADKRRDFLKENPNIDLMVMGDGEFIAEEIVRFYLKNDSIKSIRNELFPFSCSYVDGTYVEGPENGEYRLGLAKDKTSMEDFPSPYLSGIFDKFFKDGESPLLETNRGCPFTCTYCQQGDEYFQKVRQFPPGRFKKELNYIANKIQELRVDITTIELTDPNFGMFKRDEEICTSIRECQDMFDFPKFVGCSTGKNRADTIIKNTTILKEGTIFLRSSMQSMNIDALKAVKRQNIKLDTYQEIQKNAISRNLDSNADMMLGFPGETLDSHTEGILTLLDAGTKEFAQYQTIALKGTEFEKEEYREKHGIKIRHRPIPECFREYSILGSKTKVIESEEIIIETSSMEFKEYLACRRLHLVIMVFHNSRLLDLVYSYLDSREISHSDLIRCIMKTKNEKFLDLLNEYTYETTAELFDSVDDMFSVGELEKYTHNKIFRHMAIALFKNKQTVVRVIEEALIDLVGEGEFKVVQELCQILSLRIVDPQEKLLEKTLDVETPQLAQIFGKKVHLMPTQHQLASLKMLGKIYKTDEDVINKFIYHLRPKNTVIQIGCVP